MATADPQVAPVDQSLFFFLPRFAGMNLLAPRQQLEDGEHSWLENFLPISTSAMTVVPGPQTVGQIKIPNQNPQRMWHVVLAGVDYLLVWTSQRNLWLCNIVSGAQQRINGNILFSQPDIAVWTGSVILIADPLGGYCTWDGAVFTQVDNTVGRWQLVTVFAGRAFFVQNNNVYLFTAPLSYLDFNVAHGAVQNQVTMDGLRKAIYHVQPVGDWLYLVGDGGIYAIGNVQGSGAHQLMEVERNHGTTFYAGVDSVDRSLVFAANDNVYALVGFQPVSLTPSLSPLFGNFDVSKGMHLTLATIYGIQVMLVRTTYLDPTFGPRAVFVGIYGGKNFLLSQGVGIIYTCTVELANTFFTYATDGDVIFALFQDTVSPVSFKLQTKMYDMGNPAVVDLAIRAGVEESPVSLAGSLILSVDSEFGSDAGPILTTGDLTFVNNSGNIVQFTGNAGQNIFWFTGGAGLGSRSSNVRGKYLGFTLTGNNPGLTVGGFVMEYKHSTVWP